MMMSMSRTLEMITLCCALSRDSLEDPGPTP